MHSVQDQLEIRFAHGPAVHAGSWEPLTVLLTRPEGCSGSVRVRHIDCTDPDVRVNLDLLEQDMEVRPGETYRLTVPILVSRPKVLDLDSFRLQIAGSNDLLRFPAQKLTVHPALARELEIDLEPVCAYEAGTRVQLMVQHWGTTVFRDLTVRLGPDEVVAAGKCPLRRETFSPGDREEAEFVVAAEAVDVVLVASAGEGRTEARRTVGIPRPPARAQRNTFHFLEPRRLAADRVVVFEADGEARGRRLVPPAGSVFPLRGGQSYWVHIRPGNPQVADVNLPDVAGKVSVRKKEPDAARRLWRFLVEVHFSELWTAPDCLYYTAATRDGPPLAGEVPVAFRPALGRHLRIAAALGIAVTIQGFAALGRLLAGTDRSVKDLLTGFHLTHDYPLLFCLAVPVLWGSLRLVDRVQYRLRT